MYTLWKIKKDEYLQEPVGQVEEVTPSSVASFLECDPSTVVTHDLHVPLYQHPGCYGAGFGILTYVKLGVGYRVQEVYQHPAYGTCARDDGLFVLPSDDPYARPGHRMALFQVRGHESHRLQEETGW